MGLGKTASTLALHLLNPPQSEGDETEWGKKDLDFVSPGESDTRKAQYGAHRYVYTSYSMYVIQDFVVIVYGSVCSVISCVAVTR
jgi:hypothetical protein